MEFFSKFENLGFFVQSEPISSADACAVDLQCAKNFSPARQLEFLTGRYCAQQALKKIGINDVAIGVGSARQPLWPEGVVGSIAHEQGLHAAVVGKKSLFESVGIDLIPRARETEVDELFRRSLGDEGEFRAVQDLQLDSEGAALFIFCIKEALYKYLYPLTLQDLGFLDVALLTVDPQKGIFVVRLKKYLNAAYTMGTEIRGHFAINEDWIASLVVTRNQT